MKLLSILETTQVSAAYASMVGSFSMGPGGITFGTNFVVTVTDASSNILGNFKVYPNKVINGANGVVLYDGSQSSFCFNGYNFSVSEVVGGHAYSCTGLCQ